MGPVTGGLEPKSWAPEALGYKHLILGLVALNPGSLGHPQAPGTRCTLWLRPQRVLSFLMVLESREVRRERPVLWA